MSESFGVFAFVYVLSFGDVDYLSSEPALTTLALFVGFGAISAALWLSVGAQHAAHP